MESKKEFFNLDEIRLEKSDMEMVEQEYERFLESIENVKGDIEVLVGEENRYLHRANEELRREIEERRKIELTLNDQLLFLEALMDAIPNPIVYYAKNNGYLGSNRAFLEFAGVERKAIAGLPRDAILRVEKIEEAASRVMCEGKCVVEECVITNASGKRREMMVYSSGYETSSRDGGGRVEVLIDIMEQKEIDRKQRAQEQLLIQQSKMAAMGEMISHISDQWRQPLDALSRVIAEIMEAHGAGKLDKRYIAASIDKGTRIAKGMAQTIDDFGSFFKPDKEAKTFSIEETVHVTLELLSATLKGHNIAVTVSGDCGVKVRGYQNEYAQVLLNILHNATDILVERSIAKPKISITFGRRGNKTFITVADNGGGIKQSMEDKIFLLYFSTKKESTGTGVGLYMAKSITEQHLGGTITVKNSDEGAVFTVEVPASGV